MTRGIEDSVRSLFEGQLREESVIRGGKLRVFPVNAQDTYAAGDVIFSDEARLTLIEFKSDEHSLRDENRKPRRKVLCELLLKNSEMKDIHDLCHLAAWNDDDTIMLNIYRHEICHRGFFPDCGALPEGGGSFSRCTIDDYAEAFFTSNSVSVPLDSFERYLAWVMTETSGSERSTVSVQARDITTRKFRMLTFNSIRAAHDWFAEHKPQPRNQSSPSRPFR